MSVQTRRPQASDYRPVSSRRHSAVPSSTRLANSAYWLALVVVFAGVFELTCRVEDWVMYRMPIGSPFRSVEDLIVRDADGMHGRPNAQFEKWVMNGLGTRGPAATVLPSPGTVRIITVGASETFGLKESPNQEYPRQLEESLTVRRDRLRCSDSSTIPTARFEVLNAAFAGMSVPTIDQDVRNRLRRFRPAMVVAYPSPLAYLYDSLPVAAQPDSTSRSTPLGAGRGLYPRSLDRVREQLKQMLPEFVKSRLRQRQTDRVTRRHEPGWQFTAAPAERLAAFDLDLRHLVGTIRSVGATPVLVSHGNAFFARKTLDRDKLIAWQKVFPRATGRTLISFDSLSRLITIKVGADSNVTVVDAAARLGAAPESAFADAVHFTDLGASTMASLIGDGVFSALQRTDSCLVPCCAAPISTTDAVGHLPETLGGR